MSILFSASLLLVKVIGMLNVCHGDAHVGALKGTLLQWQLKEILESGVQLHSGPLQAFQLR